MSMNVGSGRVLCVSLVVGLVLVAGAMSARAQEGCGDGNPNCGKPTPPPAAVEGDVPEIGLGALGSAVTLLAGGYFVITSKLRRRT